MQRCGGTHYPTVCIILSDGFLKQTDSRCKSKVIRLQSLQFLIHVDYVLKLWKKLWENHEILNCIDVVFWLNKDFKLTWVRNKKTIATQRERQRRAQRETETKREGELDNKNNRERERVRGKRRDQQREIH